MSPSCNNSKYEEEKLVQCWRIERKSWPPLTILLSCGFFFLALNCKYHNNKNNNKWKINNNITDNLILFLNTFTESRYFDLVFWRNGRQSEQCHPCHFSLRCTLSSGATWSANIIIVIIVSCFGASTVTLNQTTSSYSPSCSTLSGQILMWAVLSFTYLSVSIRYFRKSNREIFLNCYAKYNPDWYEIFLWEKQYFALILRSGLI